MIAPDKKKCISCNVCTSVCHQGIDVMNFANKGLPMEDPECVRCSACVQMCPTGVLQFGTIDTATGRFSSAEARPGATVLPLFRDTVEDVRLEHWAPATAVTLPEPGGIELLVLDGGFTESNEYFGPLSWLRLPAGATLSAAAGPEGCRVWVKSGHLAAVSARLPSD